MRREREKRGGKRESTIENQNIIVNEAEEKKQTLEQMKLKRRCGKPSKGGKQIMR